MLSVRQRGIVNKKTYLKKQVFFIVKKNLLHHAGHSTTTTHWGHGWSIFFDVNQSTLCGQDHTSY
jgi:hypothetical protein